MGRARNTAAATMRSPPHAGRVRVGRLLVCGLREVRRAGALLELRAPGVPAGRVRRPKGLGHTQALGRGGHLVPAAHELPLEPRLAAERCPLGAPAAVVGGEQRLGGGGGVRGLGGGQVPRVGHGLLQGRLAHAGDEPQAQGLLRGHHAPSERQVQGHVQRHEVAEGHGPRHVRDEAPLGLHNGEGAVGRGEAEVRAQGDLQAAAEAHAGHCGDDRCGAEAPEVADVLGEGGPGLWTLREQLLDGGGHGKRVTHEALHVQSRAERPPFAVEDHRTAGSVLRDLLRRAADGAEHVHVEGVQLGRPVQGDHRHVALLTHSD
mmetsp:Transcript_1240/g.3948  ORF Transcript_1240/g.3948 Transcript_1240/m.3948 type:complete len:319 (-) Transcript_1240:84-1040(-)